MDEESACRTDDLESLLPSHGQQKLAGAKRVTSVSPTIHPEPRRARMQLNERLVLLATTDTVNPRMPDSVATRRHLFLVSFLAPFLLPERARTSGRCRRYLLALDRQDMPSRIASTASTRVL
jgi:hypothetical protein